MKNEHPIKPDTLNKENLMKIQHVFNRLFLFIFLAMLCVSCATTHQERSVKTSGFLNDYSQLKEGTDDQALMVYIDTGVQFNQYSKVIIDPVRLVATEDSDMAKISTEDRQAIANYFYAALNENLSKKYTIVTEPGPQTMRLRVALTDMAGSKVVLDTLSSIVPFGIAFNMISVVATGNSLSVGSATGEMELLDSTTGKRLAAAVDGRAGAKYTGKFDKWEKWNDTKEACDFWAERIETRLEELSGAGKSLK
ncbi:MAG: DUF3313 domain-containing protein [Desulfobacteraceae bacterium]|nr:MAG: DUF3313 domain-containing protein [Desulfobacteraceae bacterium]